MKSSICYAAVTTGLLMLLPGGWGQEIISDAPSLVPSDMPSMVPSDMPSMVPSMIPSASPTKEPSMGSDYPSLVPINWGTPEPTRGDDAWATPEVKKLSSRIIMTRARRLANLRMR